MRNNKKSDFSRLNVIKRRHLRVFVLLTPGSEEMSPLTVRMINKLDLSTCYSTCATHKTRTNAAGRKRGQQNIHPAIVNCQSVCLLDYSGIFAITKYARIAYTVNKTEIKTRISKSQSLLVVFIVITMHYIPHTVPQALGTNRMKRPASRVRKKASPPGSLAFQLTSRAS
jgi:hypothetical protein